MEQRVKPPIERLAAPNYAFGVTTLSVQEATVLAAWATKTAWIRDLLSEPGTRTSPAMREYLRVHESPPDFTDVWIARYHGDTEFGSTSGRIGLTHQDEPWNSSFRHVLTCLLVFRGLAIFVRSADGWGVPPLTLPQDAWRQLWPVEGTVVWPPDASVTDNALQDVSMNYSSWSRLPQASFVQYREPVHRVRRN
jgi:hypothetical protein